MIHEENCRQSTGIGARFRLCVGRPLDPPIPLYPAEPCPLLMALDSGFDAGVEQNNPSGDTAENDDNVVFFDAFVVLPAVNNDVAANNNNDISNASLGPLADANNMDSTPTPPGFLAEGISAPSAPEASLGLLAGRSNSLGNAYVLGVGPDDVEGNVSDPIGDGASGDQPLGLLTKGGVSPPASPDGTIDLADRGAPSALEPSLSASRPAGATCWGTLTSRGWIPTTSTATLWILLATGCWATNLLAF